MVIDSKPNQYEPNAKPTVTVTMSAEEAYCLILQWDLYDESLMVSGPMRDMFRGIVRALARESGNPLANSEHPINRRM